MPTFTPPTVSQAWPTDNPLTDRISLPRGLCVISDGDGGWYTEQFPWQGTLQDLVEGTDYFLGGHTYTVTTAIGNSLTAAGFTVG